MKTKQYQGASDSTSDKKSDALAEVKERQGTIGSRLAAARSRLGLNHSEFGTVTGVPVSSLKKYEGGHSVPGGEAIQLIAKAGVNIHWLVTGEGPMLLTDQLAASAGTSLDEFAMVPVYDVAASAGHGALAEDSQPTRELAFRKDWLLGHGFRTEDLAVIEVKGDSMSPTINAGDTILVDMSDTDIGADAIYVVRMNEHLYAKRLQRTLDGAVRVISDNSAYQAQVIEEGRLQDLHVVGRVVWGGRFFV